MQSKAENNRNIEFKEIAPHVIHLYFTQSLFTAFVWNFLDLILISLLTNPNMHNKFQMESQYFSIMMRMGFNLDIWVPQN